MRTDSRGAQTWTGIADLPGELFVPDSATARETVKLRAYDALIWVIDPAVSPALDQSNEALGGTESYAEVMDGSLRPGTTQQVGARQVRTKRDQIQVEIGRRLTLIDGLMAGPDEHSLQLLVAVSKADLIHATLAKQDLGHLGEPGVVQRGVAGFLAVITDRWANQLLDTDEESTRILAYLHAGNAVDSEVRRARILQTADGLLAHYSHPDSFWNLVHGGAPETLRVPDGGAMTLPPWSLTVPGIDAYLDAALLPGSASRLHLRDLVMSALGCGITYGLGQETAIFKILREQWLTLRFFLCSPLATIPVAVDDRRLRPRDAEATFPRAQERSAGLTQLLLATLGKARR